MPVEKAGLERHSYIYASSLTRRERAWRARRMQVRSGAAMTMGSALVAVGGVAAVLAHLLVG